MECLGAQTRKCIFCNQPVALENVAWMINEGLLRELLLDEEEGAQETLSARIDKNLWDALDRFARLDEKGTSFYAMMSGKEKQKNQRNRVRVVLPEDLGPSWNPGKKSLNTYTTQANEEIPIFQRPDPANNDLYLRFTERFVQAMQDSGLECFQLEYSRHYIEERCIRPVCAECMSYIPRELLDISSQNTYVVRLAYIGPVGSGKTTLNWTNLVFEKFNQGGWIHDSEELYNTTHYLARNYYEMQVQEKKLPPPTQKEEYTPPLLVRLRRNDKNLLLVLMDMAGELLQQIHQDHATGRNSRQTFAYSKIIERMDGFLLMLDSDTEILPKVGVDPPLPEDDGSGKKKRSPVTLYRLVQSCASNGKLNKKPAALLLTKCDMLFNDLDHSYLEEEHDELFSMFSPVECAFWQQPDSQNIRVGYETDYHECIQLPFKAFVQKWFPQLWNVLENGFSRVDVFPEASLGIVPNGTTDEEFDLSKLKPFHTVDPIFWLLDMIDFSRREGS